MTGRQRAQSVPACLTSRIPPPTSRRRHIVRLALVVAFLLGLFYLVAVARVIDVEDVRRAVAATGPAAPLAYVVVSAVLGAMFVPGADPGGGQRRAVRARARTVRDAGRDGRDGDHRQPDRPPRRPEQRTRTARDGARRSTGRSSSSGGDCGRSSGSGSSPASRTRWPHMHSARSEFRCGRWPSARSSARCRGRSSTRRWARRSGTCPHRWPMSAIAIWCVTAVIGAFATHHGYRKWRLRTERTGHPTIDCDAVTLGRTMTQEPL